MSRKNDQEFEEIAPVLRELRRAGPDRAASQRIVEGAMARIQGKRRPFALRPWGLAFGGGLAAIAATVALRLSSPTVAPVEPAHPPVAEGDLLHNVGDAILVHALGPHRIELAPGARLQVQDARPLAAELQLLEGEVTFDVEALGDEGHFYVKTDQLRVEVVGTRFRVATEGACSEVRVEAGRVRMVDGLGRARHLGPGESDRSCQRSSAESQLREALVLVSSGRDLARAAELLQRFRSERPQSPLQEEALFHLSLVRARLGEMEEAQRLAEEFARRYPGSERLERLQKGLQALSP